MEAKGKYKLKLIIRNYRQNILRIDVASKLLNMLVSLGNIK